MCNKNLSYLSFGPVFIFSHWHVSEFTGSYSNTTVPRYCSFSGESHQKKKNVCERVYV